MTYQELNEQYKEKLDQLVAVFHTHFPNGHIRVGFYDGITRPYFTMKCALIGDINDVSWCNRHNDPMYIQVQGHFQNDLQDIELTSLRSGLTVESSVDHLYCETVKLRFRKKTIKANEFATKGFDALTKFMKTMAVTVIAHKDQIKNLDEIKEKYLIVNP